MYFIIFYGQDRPEEVQGSMLFSVRYVYLNSRARVYNPNTEALKGGVQLGAIGPIGLKPVLFPVDTYVLKNMVEFISPNSYRYHTTYKYISGTKVLYLNKQFFSNFTFFLLFKSVEYSWISLKNDAARWSEWVIVA